MRAAGAQKRARGHVPQILGRKICAESLALPLKLETLLRLSNTALQEPTGKNGAGEKERRDPRESKSAKRAKRQKKEAAKSFAVVGFA